MSSGHNSIQAAEGGQIFAALLRQQWRAPFARSPGGLPSAARRAEDGGAEGNRTPDLLIANEALSQLSYGPNP